MPVATSIESEQLRAIAGIQAKIVEGIDPQRIYEHLLSELLDLAGAESGFVAELHGTAARGREIRLRAARDLSLGGAAPLLDLGRTGKWSEPEGFREGRPCTLPAGSTRALEVVALGRGDRIVGVAGVEPGRLRGGGLEPIRAFLDCVAVFMERDAALRDRMYEDDVVGQERSEMVCRLNPDGRIQSMNRACAEVFGTTPHEAAGRGIGELFPEIGEGDVCEFLASFDPARPVSTTVNRVRGPDGESRWIQWTTRAAFDDAGNRSALRAVGIDITGRREGEAERVEFENRLQQTQRLECLGVLAGGIAHDFNNLITGILGNAGLVAAEMSVDSPAIGQLGEIERGARRAADLCDQLLAYTGRSQTNRTTICLSELVEEMVGILKLSVSKNARLELDLPDTLPLILAEPTRMRQIVMNLITNASDALGADGGRIRISTTTLQHPMPDGSMGSLTGELPAGHYVEFAVSDSGAGMKSEIVDRIFDPFFTTKSSGRGLGLAAVRDIVRDHRGGIGIESEPGRGTTIRILLPASAGPAPVRPPLETKPNETTSGGTVLVVDDEASVRIFIRACLERYGFDVLVAEDGVSGLQVFREQREQIHTVLLDLTMPRLGGAEVLQEIRKIDPHANVILSSGYDEQETRRRFSGQGLSGFLHKPFGPRELLAALRDVGSDETP